ncbi:spoIIIJ-associated protein [Prauserella sediminis]|uniref:SpoIIIJ-associated protein n=1 Tax=Prauserella sediminis TaxID=577680 RepID=A0A839XMI2_9PSEU|nr:R3H domain-containing nucleic acid-binding protein [Prauserella sediminis]MBB3662724.1 spoIIIJ-associated protein [Prauserella sediminis]
MSETAEVIGTEEEKATAVAAGADEDTTAPDDTGAADSPGDAESGDAESGDDLLVREGDIAGDYLERLLDLLDYDGDIDLDVEAGRAIVSIDGGDDLEKLVGPRGTVLEALQELTRLAVQQETGSRSRLMLDVAGWRAGRREELRRIGRTAAENVAKTGEKEKLQPMSPFERKVVHDAVAEVEGVTSESEGEEPKRRVVVVPE